MPICFVQLGVTTVLNAIDLDSSGYVDAMFRICRIACIEYHDVLHIDVNVLRETRRRYKCS